MAKTAMLGQHRGNKSSATTSGPIQQMVQTTSASLLYGRDNTSLQFTGWKLNGKHWFQWSQAVK